MALSIIRHAFAMVFGSFGQALRLSIGPFLIAAIILIIVARSMNIGFVSFAVLAMNPENANPAIMLYILFVLIVITVVSAWVAVAWHRFILLEEYAQVLPKFRDRPIGGYILTTFAVTFWIFLVSLLGGFVLGFFLAVTGLSGSFLAGFVGGILIGVLSSYVWFRLALSLPGRAIGKPLKLRESFNLTGPVSSTLWRVIFILVIFNTILQSASGFIAPSSIAVQICLSVVVYWITFMVGLSVLTTFYGHLVEKRPLTH